MALLDMNSWFNGLPVAGLIQRSCNHCGALIHSNDDAGKLDHFSQKCDRSPRPQAEADETEAELAVAVDRWVNKLKRSELGVPLCNKCGLALYESGYEPPPNRYYHFAGQCNPPPSAAQEQAADINVWADGSVLIWILPCVLALCGILFAFCGKTNGNQNSNAYNEQSNFFANRKSFPPIFAVGFVILGGLWAYVLLSGRTRFLNSKWRVLCILYGSGLFYLVCLLLHNYLS